MQTQNCDNTRKKMNTEVDLSSMKSFKTIFMTDANISKKKTIASQASLHNVQLLRNLPNILRSSNTKTSRNHKLLNKIDTSIFGAEDGNSSLELNTSSSVDLDVEVNYNKITSPKSHHQRKQVHNPLDIQYDISDCNNNKNKKLLQKVNQLNTLNVTPSCEKNTSTKKLKYNNKQKKSSFNKKLKKIIARKSGSKTQMSHKKLDTSAIIPDINVKNTMQDANNILENGILLQSIYNNYPPNFPNINVNDLNDVATKPVESSNMFYCNNEVYNFEKQCDINLNDIISYKPTEITMQSETIEKNITSDEFLITENNLQRKSIDSYIGSNFLCGSKILYPCSCANCMSRDKDIIFYEDPISTSTSSDDTEAELFTCDLHTDIYDFYINNYSHIFDDNLMDLEENFYYQEFGESISTKENECNSNNNTTELIESSAISSINQNKSQNLQPCHIDRNDICVESYPTAFITYPNETIRMENSRAIDEIDIPNYLNLDSFSMKENKIISQDEILIQNAVSSAVSNSKCQTLENKTDLCVIQCTQCRKLFNKKHQLWKHFTHCDFYKENFQCHICNKIYRHKSSLAQHLRLVHNVSHGLHEKFYTCKKCSKSYVRFRSFQRHMLLHDD